ncbi:hypothetical protein C1H46_043603 [Malus baccata]|uniref:Uncharacterized protein n=1 Tax=Malus baccata TaxID=106549 RepID=A0A540K9F0_MALBA|nr:hypothetical protein C1H46_043603 [Malus baccata]
MVFLGLLGPVLDEVSVQLAAQDEKMRAHSEQLRAQMSMIVHALAMFGLQIQLPTSDLTPPSTSQPLRLADTQ